MALCASTSQTVGPFFHLGLSQLNLAEVAGLQATGERITLEGAVLDGDRKAVPDALVEIWQANAHGKYAHEVDTQEKPLEPGFRGMAAWPHLPTVDSAFTRFAPAGFLVPKARCKLRIWKFACLCAVYSNI